MPDEKQAIDNLLAAIRNKKASQKANEDVKEEPSVLSEGSSFTSEYERLKAEQDAKGLKD